ncbi:MAG: hypothetical protein AAF085_14100, partial [Planctomycetota bacterium]
DLLVMSAFFSNTELTSEQKADTIIWLNPEVITQWVLSEDISAAPGEVQSLAVDYAINTLQRNREEIPGKIETLLADFSEAIDSRQAIWLKHFPADADTAEIRDAVFLVLKNDQLEDHLYRFALRSHIEFIKNEIDLQQSGLTADQAERINKFLDQSE